MIEEGFEIVLGGCMPNHPRKALKRIFTSLNATNKQKSNLAAYLKGALDFLLLADILKEDTVLENRRRRWVDSALREQRAQIRA